MEKLTSRDDRDTCSICARPLLSLTRTATIIHAEAGKTLLIVGPASFELREGEASVLGAPLDSSKNVVTRGKQTPVEIHSPSTFRIMLGQEGSVEELDGSTIPVSWREAASALSELAEGTAVVIGGADTGKTTLCTFLANCLTNQHRHVAVVDADIGQTDLGPPTTMAAGDVREPVVNLSRVEPSERLFIGFTSPGRVKGKVIRCVKRLVGCHAGADRVVIVNTDGWVTGTDAASYKVQMLDDLHPDITLGIGSPTDLSEILQAANCTALLVSSPDTIRERTLVDRKALRALGYQKYLSGSSMKTFQIDGVSLSGSLTPEALNLRRFSRREFEPFKDCIVGFLDANGFLQEVGILKDVAPSTMTVKIWSRITSTPAGIEIGDVRLSNDGRELSHVTRE
jgi:polynucleotide 5'-hydroxyl-kinase GRC3/NOL9